jgi:DNA-binding MarR family transcriptional regulator
MKKDEQTATIIVGLIPLLLRKVNEEIRCCGQGIVPSHFRLLAHLATHSSNISDLASQQSVSLATMSKSVDTLVERGWVKRGPVANDRRSYQIEITNVGLNAFLGIHYQLTKSFTALFSSLSEGELIQLESGMQILKQELENHWQMKNSGRVKK